MQSFKNQIKAFFNFNKRQERGAFVLIVLIILAFAADLFLPIILNEKPYDYTSALAEIEVWKATAKEKVHIEIKAKSEKLNRDRVEIIKLSPFAFNPNKLPKEKWLEMGLPSRVVATIQNYEAKGGSFRKADDLQKIYGLTPEMYDQLKYFINIPSIDVTDKIINSRAVSLIEEPETDINLDINRTDSIEFLQVPGIGPFYAGQIVNYRNRLGGYHSLEQLNELWKMDSSRLQPLLPYLSFKDTILRQIDINAVDFKTILKHPYIDYEMAKKILNFRNKLGRYAGLYQLKTDNMISDSLFQKLEPYLRVD